MNILGINAYHADASACLVVDGKLVAAAEEERFRRIKHWAGFPTESIRYCLEAGGISIAQVDHVALNRDPDVHLFKKALFLFSKRPSLKAVQNRLMNASKIRDINSVLSQTLSVPKETLRHETHSVEHHRAHMASAFFVSGFDSASVLSVDGFGDYVSAMWGLGKKSTLTVKDQIYFPHSLGLFYLAMTQYLGFRHYGEEYKVMGLASYGKPTKIQKIRKVLKLKTNGYFELDLDYFLHHSKGIEMVWDEGSPVIGSVYSEKLEELLGPARRPEEPITEFHQDLAASAQRMYEEGLFNVLDSLYAQTKNPNLCLAGGCAMNSVANGKIKSRTKFSQIYIQAASGDAGGAIGAAYFVWNQVLKRERCFVMNQAYWGPDFSDAEINEELKMKNKELKKNGCLIENIQDREALVEKTANVIAQGKIVGWFQGRMELGARALGNRSILCDPRSEIMKDLLNSRIKHRESFRPFAPSILRDKVSEWFETDGDVPFMSQVYEIRPSKRRLIPAVTHVDGTGRLQTVSEKENPLYSRLISEFEKLTGVPILLNTSFNENEPIVCAPGEALDCFLRNPMDVLVIGNFIISK